MTFEDAIINFGSRIRKSTRKLINLFSNPQEYSVSKTVRNPIIPPEIYDADPEQRKKDFWIGIAVIGGAIAAGSAGLLATSNQLLNEHSVKQRLIKSSRVRDLTFEDDTNLSIERQMRDVPSPVIQRIISSNTPLVSENLSEYYAYLWASHHSVGENPPDLLDLNYESPVTNTKLFDGYHVLYMYVKEDEERDNDRDLLMVYLGITENLYKRDKNHKNQGDPFGRSYHDHPDLFRLYVLLKTKDPEYVQHWERVYLRRIMYLEKKYQMDLCYNTLTRVSF